MDYLSCPKGESVNDGISKEASVSYVLFEAIGQVRACGVGALLAKSDYEAEFHLLLVHAACYHLLGFMVDGQYFYDMCLPMGCSTTRF